MVCADVADKSDPFFKHSGAGLKEHCPATKNWRGNCKDNQQNERHQIATTVKGPLNVESSGRNSIGSFSPHHSTC